jgi:hypothetical protein
MKQNASSKKETKTNTDFGKGDWEIGKSLNVENLFGFKARLNLNL